MATAGAWVGSWPTAAKAASAANSRGDRYPRAECGLPALYHSIYERMADLASSRLSKVCCHANSSFIVRMKRSHIPFSCGVLGVMYSCVSR